MTSLLYYSISSNLTEDEIIEIDKQITQNRSNAKNKTRKVIFVIILGGALYFNNVQPSEAVGLPMPSASVVRVGPSFEYSLKKPELAKLVPRKPDRISYKYFSRSKQELLLLIYATDPRLASNQQILKLVKKFRGGSWDLLGTAAFLGLIILIFSTGQGFV